MKTLVKIMVTLAVVGVILIFFAAATQEFNRPLADILGYSGLVMWGVDALVMGTWFLVSVWTDDKDCYL